MVIERALEKMRQAAIGTQTWQAGTAQRTAPVVERRASASAAAPDAPQRPKPLFKQLEIDHEAAERSRVLLPGSTGDAAGAAASYRMIRTRFLQLLGNNRWTSLAITSPGAAEGKSLTTLNLALSMARDKASDVFLIDLDMRNPSICRYLGARPDRELLQYFEGVGEPSEALYSIGVPNLAIAGSTVPTEHASELVSGPRLQELMSYIRSVAANPVILIDLPPLLVTDEALLVAPRVDATALVVAEGRTRRDGLARAKQLLSDFSFAGVILNRSSETFGADSYYGYGYRYDKPA